MTIQDRITGARAYLAKLPSAISGQGGHPATYRAASILANGFDLGWDDAWSLLQEWNATHCSPPWGERDLKHKLNDAYVKPHERPKGWLVQNRIGRSVGVNGRMVFNAKGAIESAMGGVPLTTGDLLLAAFKDEDYICITNEAGQSDDGRFFPASRGMFLSRREWLERFFQPGASAGKHFAGTEQGAWVRINPFKADDVSGTDAGISDWRHVLVEFDRRPKAEQIAIFQQSNLPITALIDSGGKSVHAWVRVDAKDKQEWEQRRNAVYEFLADYEPDPQNKNPSRWSRLGGIARGKDLQKVIALSVGAKDWGDWEAWKDGQDLPDELRPDFLELYDTKNDPNHLVGHGRWLCRGSSLLITGQSGIGKSSFTMQMACSWALGRELFGIPTKKALRIGVVQAENDAGDLAEAFQGVTSAMGLSIDDRKKLSENLVFYTETSKTGKDFAEVIRKIVVRNKLDMIICDPLLSYIGGDLSKQEVASYFLRNLMGPIMKDTGVIVVFTHHEGKPKPKEVTEGQTISDMAYSGLGSSELVNWARAIINIRRESRDLPIFSFNLTKRGNLAGMRLDGGKETLSIKLRHATGKVLWEVAPMTPKFELLQVGAQYQHFATKPSTARASLIKELIEDHGLARDQAEALLKALVTNGIMEPRRVGAAIFYVGTKV